MFISGRTVSKSTDAKVQHADRHTLCESGPPNFSIISNIRNTWVIRGQTRNRWLQGGSDTTKSRKVFSRIWKGSNRTILKERKSLVVILFRSLEVVLSHSLFNANICLIWFLQSSVSHSLGIWSQTTFYLFFDITVGLEQYTRGTLASFLSKFPKSFRGAGDLVVLSGFSKVWQKPRKIT